MGSALGPHFQRLPLARFEVANRRLTVPSQDLLDIAREDMQYESSLAREAGGRTLSGAQFKFRWIRVQLNHKPNATAISPWKEAIPQEEEEWNHVQHLKLVNSQHLGLQRFLEHASGF